MKDLTIKFDTISPSGLKAATSGRRATRVLEILEVAIAVFATDGNAGFSQRRVAAAAGVRLATVQHYFGTRDELLIATFDEMSHRLMGRFRSLAANETETPERRLKDLLNETFDALTDADNLFSRFVIECWCLAEHNEEINERIVTFNGEFQSLFSGLVAQINPALGPEESRIRGAMIYSHWQGLIVFMRRSGRNRPDVATFRNAAEVVWRALSAGG
ncbi:TetR/AcrR family transcriptional regulator [Paraburkholderia oxyphila]|uniref:TetR/AcrR family transcriptional regulator n=1 Tax=Paraburkholderia oxyphila TaxID=614212 RepID=UPI000485580E|nr:TetR/AcrR family transcriptional regulator [Paraburkholderia oxyphila]